VLEHLFEKVKIEKKCKNFEFCIFSANSSKGISQKLKNVFEKRYFMFLFVNSIFLKFVTSKSNSIFKTLCSLRYSNKIFMTVLQFYSKRGLKFERMYGKKPKKCIFLIACCKIFVFYFKKKKNHLQKNHNKGK
jgi:hypothetical protein